MTTEQFIDKIKLLMDEYCVSQCMYIPDEVKRREIETWIIKTFDYSSGRRYYRDSDVIREFFLQNPLDERQKSNLKEILNRKYGGKNYE